MRSAALTAAAALAWTLSGCGFISFRPAPTDEELRLTASVRAYYGEVQRAFAAGNAQALASLFDASLTQPMTRAEVESWAEKFFSEHGRARLRILALDIDDIGYEKAQVRLKYAVEPADGKGGFAAAEEDTLVRRQGRWYTAAWEKLP